LNPINNSHFILGTLKPQSRIASKVQGGMLNLKLRANRINSEVFLTSFLP
jgi:hypothetical protein